MITTNVENEVIVENKGDKFWCREFDYDESIQRVSLLERRGIEFQIKVGLELLRVKTQLKHGKFIAYLAIAGFTNTDTPERRMKIARQYMCFLGLRDSPKIVNPAENEVLVALEIAYSENPQFADFNASRKADLNENVFFRKMFPDEREEAGKNIDPYYIIGFNPYELTNRLWERWDNLNTIEKVQSFLLIHNCFLQLKVVLHEMKEMEPRIKAALEEIQSEGKTAEDLSNAISRIKREDLELDLE